MPSRPHLAAPDRQSGTSAIEFTLVAIPLLLVGLGAIELSRWFFVKQAISLALLEAARAGITDHARPATIEAAFEHALLPLFPATSRQSAAQRLREAFDRRHSATDTAPWQIQVQKPDAAVFHDFAAPGLSVRGAPGLATIDNNYQAEQHVRYTAQRPPDGRGAFSGATIFEANNLALQLTYMHEPLVPGMRALLQMLSPHSSGYSKQAFSGGYLPLQQTLQLTMQSHPVAWPAGGFKIVAAATPAAHPPVPASGGVLCSGLWCPAQAGGAEGPMQPITPPRNGLPLTGIGLDTAPAPPAASPDPLDADSALCGVVVCCTVQA